MRYGTKVVAIGILIVLVAVGGALAVGYERYNAEGTSDGQIKANATASPDVLHGGEASHFCGKGPGCARRGSCFHQGFPCPIRSH